MDVYIYIHAQLMGHDGGGARSCRARGRAWVTARKIRPAAAAAAAASSLALLSLSRAALSL